MAVRSVLAGAYRGKLDSARITVTHAVGVDEDGMELGAKTVCGRVKLERLADEHGAPHLAAPTCPACAERVAR